MGVQEVLDLWDDDPDPNVKSEVPLLCRDLVAFLSRCRGFVNMIGIYCDCYSFSEDGFLA